MMRLVSEKDYLAHHGIKGQEWGVRRFQESDGSLTLAGRKRYLASAKATVNKKKTVKSAGVKKGGGSSGGSSGSQNDTPVVRKPGRRDIDHALLSGKDPETPPAKKEEIDQPDPNVTVPTPTQPAKKGRGGGGGGGRGKKAAAKAVKKHGQKRLREITGEAERLGRYVSRTVLSGTLTKATKNKNY